MKAGLLRKWIRNKSIFLLCSDRSLSILLSLLNPGWLTDVYFLTFCGGIIVAADSLSLSPSLAPYLNLGHGFQIKSLGGMATRTSSLQGCSLSEPSCLPVICPSHVGRPHVGAAADSASWAPSSHLASAASHVCEPSWMLQPNCTFSCSASADIKRSRRTTYLNPVYLPTSEI